jgi:hypothetical protein
MKLKLIRTYNADGTNGVLLVNNEFLCFTIELPWRRNLRSISCIPERIYEVAERESSKHGKHLWLPEVPGRDLILFHGANNAQKDLRGCIAPVFLLTGKGRGEDSKVAVHALYGLVARELEQKEPVTLEIISLEKQLKTFGITIQQ